MGTPQGTASGVWVCRRVTGTRALSVSAVGESRPDVGVNMPPARELPPVPQLERDERERRAHVTSESMRRGKLRNNKRALLDIHRKETPAMWAGWAGQAGWAGRWGP